MYGNTVCGEETAWSDLFYHPVAKTSSFLKSVWGLFSFQPFMLKTARFHINSWWMDTLIQSVSAEPFLLKYLYRCEDRYQRCRFQETRSFSCKVPGTQRAGHSPRPPAHMRGYPQSGFGGWCTERTEAFVFLLNSHLRSFRASLPSSASAPCR